jgi:hypothetical protein
MLGACDATTVVFFYNPLEHEKGKTMVRVYPNGTTVKGNGIHLERPDPKPHTPPPTEEGGTANVGGLWALFCILPIVIVLLVITAAIYMAIKKSSLSILCFKRGPHTTDSV